ncbi:MAG TPA: hypothetical protein VH025_08430 [Solirubrobacteraceae bacterium]|nr:hypothetical protein [Solirubrobacteraceae bacterium]
MTAAICVVHAGDAYAQPQRSLPAGRAAHELATAIRRLESTQPQGPTTRRISRGPSRRVTWRLATHLTTAQGDQHVSYALSIATRRRRVVGVRISESSQEARVDGSFSDWSGEVSIRRPAGDAPGVWDYTVGFSETASQPQIGGVEVGTGLSHECARTGRRMPRRIYLDALRVVRHARPHSSPVRPNVFAECR